MNKISSYHLEIGEGAKSYTYLDEWVKSEENKFFIFNESMDYFERYQNKYGVPILSYVDNATIEVINQYVELTYPYVKNKQFKSPLHKLSCINNILINIVVEKIKSKKIIPVIDPLWTRMGPSFYEDKTFDKNKSNGYKWSMEFDMFGNPKITDRFGNSKMYWNRQH